MHTAQLRHFFYQIHVAILNDTVFSDVFFAKLHFLIIQSGTLKTVLFLLYFVFPLNVCKKYYIKTSNYGFNFILLQILQYLKWTQ